MVEFPIRFENRMAGSSKISQREIYRAIVIIQRLAVQRLLPTRRPAVDPDASAEPVACCSCGGVHHAEVHPPKPDTGGAMLRDASPYSCASHSGRTHGQILKCLCCGLVFMRPKLTPEALVNEYASAEDPVDLENIQARKTTFRYNLHRVRGYIREGDRVLEIGSYCGAFLDVAREPQAKSA